MLTTKNNLLLLIILLLLLGFLPKTAFAQNEVIRTLDLFEKVEFEGHGFIQLKKGEENRIWLQSNGKVDLANIKTEIIDNTLHIRHEKGNTEVDFEILPKISVHLTYTSMEDLRLMGKIKVQTVDAIKGDDFHLKAEGYITGEVAVDVINFDLIAEGYARLAVTGSADSQHIQLEGLGKIKADELASKEVDINIDGSSYISLNVSKALYANVRGQARLEYSGQPRIQKIDKEEQAFVGTF